jgi:hypothetical protein
MSNAYLPVLITFGPFFIWLIFNMGRHKTCPDCGETLSPIQSPFNKTQRQWIEGGYVCTKCACEVDQAGNKVPPNTPLRFGSSVKAAIAIVPLAVIAGLLIFLLLQR